MRVPNELKLILNQSISDGKQTQAIKVLRTTFYAPSHLCLILAERPLGRSRRRWEDYTKMDLMERRSGGGGYGLDRAVSG
jgi:hypothetical protein